MGVKFFGRGVVVMNLATIHRGRAIENFWLYPPCIFVLDWFADTGLVIRFAASVLDLGRPRGPRPTQKLLLS